MEPSIDLLDSARILSKNDDKNDDGLTTSETSQLLNTFYINILIFTALMICFELVRHIRSIYLNRYTKRFIQAKRVPDAPKAYPLAWIVPIFEVDHEKFLEMVGLDGYMLLRYLMACFRIACFLAFWGVLVMAPVYSSNSSREEGWNHYTIANIPDDPHNNTLWMPVIFSYFFVVFFCQVMYFEYKNFIKKRVKYLVDGDRDTHPQTYYTVMIEKLPSALRSKPILTEFFEQLFPGDVYSVELAMDLDKLEDLTNQRKKVRHLLEKSIAVWKATKQRPTVWLSRDFYQGVEEAPSPLPGTFALANCLGYSVYDAIEHYRKLLGILNTNVADMQKLYFKQQQRMDAMAQSRLEEMHKFITGKASQAPVVKNITGAVETISNKAKAALGLESEGDMSEEHSKAQSGTSSENLQAMENKERQNTRTDEMQLSVDRQSVSNSKTKQVLDYGKKIVNTGVGGLAKEGLKTAEYATKGALRGVLEATRALELLTVGAYYRVSSTAFVTFRSRLSKSSSEQMLLSHEYFAMEVHAAPNHKDIIWDNVSLPMQQIEMRKSIANGTLAVGAIFWSIVVAFITSISSLESLSQEFPALQHYSDTQAYKFFNYYLAVGLLLILLALLPFIFDFISRNYEGVKVESEIQNSIMKRYFYYQLANVFVAVGLGSIATSLHQIVENPSRILSILGNSVASFSIYFANLIITRTFSGIPIEMLRIFPLIDILRVQLCTNKKKCTRRELRTGPFADPPMLYGWIYPNILMGLMIMVTYCCIAPLILPLCAFFFGALYVMYKYQLLYVYINDYQAGGFMWYAIFDQSMLVLLCGVFTLVCYLAIRKTFTSGPVYAMLPLPVLIVLFWRHCDSRFQKPAKNLSLERALEIDREVREKEAQGAEVPYRQFNKTMYRQPSLAEGALKPEAYRISKKNTTKSNLKTALLTTDDLNGTTPAPPSTESKNTRRLSLRRRTLSSTPSINRNVTDNPSSLLSPQFFGTTEEIIDGGLIAEDDDYEYEDEVEDLGREPPSSIHSNVIGERTFQGEVNNQPDVELGGVLSSPSNDADSSDDDNDNEARDEDLENSVSAFLDNVSEKPKQSLAKSSSIRFGQTTQSNSPLHHQSDGHTIVTPQASPQRLTSIKPFRKSDGNNSSDTPRNNGLSENHPILKETEPLLSKYIP